MTLMDQENLIKNKFKVGAEVAMVDDFEIESVITKNKIKVKQGDRGFIDSKGFIHYITGQAKGKIQKLDWDELEVKGYDHTNIAKMIYDVLNWHFNIYDDFLDDYEIEKEDFINAIEEILMEVL